MTLAAITLHLKCLFLEGSKSSRFSRYLVSCFKLFFGRCVVKGGGGGDAAEGQLPL